MSEDKKQGNEGEKSQEQKPKKEERPIIKYATNSYDGPTEKTENRGKQ
jgi:hypothetical protein